MKSKSFTEKKKLKSEGEENLNSGLTMKKRRHRAGKYSINEEVNVENSEDFIITFTENGETVLDVQCGTNKAKLTLEKLWQGSKGQCINFQGSWLTPNEFQYVSGRETAKDWKRSIRHQGKSIKLLLSKGYIKVTTDGPNNEYAKEVQNGNLKQKRRGKGQRRRAAKVNKVKSPVLIDIPDHSNGKEEESESSIKHGDAINRSESTDDSHDGNETDDTIENYYSENEYGYAKENSETEASSKKTGSEKFDFSTDRSTYDRNIIDYNQNLEPETITENTEESFQIKKTELTDDNDNDQTSYEFTMTENVNNRSESTDMGDKMSESPSSAATEDNLDHCVGAQTCTSKNFVESDSHSQDKTASVGVENTVAMDNSEDKNMLTERDCRELDPEEDTTAETMPVIIGDITDNFGEFQPSPKFDHNRFDTANSPPVLVAQQEEMEILKKNKKEDQTEKIEVSQVSKKFILSLPLKNNHNELPHESVKNSPDQQEASQAVEEEEKDKSDNSQITFENIDDFGQNQEHFSDASKVGKDEINNKKSRKEEKSKGKANKRKRLRKHVKRETKINITEEVTSHFSIPESTIPVEYSPVSCVPQDPPAIEQLVKKDSKNGENLKSECRSTNSPLCGVMEIQYDNISDNENNKTDHFYKDLQINKKNETSKEKIPKNIESSQNTSKIKSSSPPRESKPLINLKSTVLRKNCEVRKQSRSPIQNSYDDYMRRLEASHNSGPWNPFFPFFQLPRHFDGMSMPVSPFVSPYPPVLGNAKPQNKDTLPHSLKTPTSSPLQSPFAATSPPSFEIPRIPPAPPLWYETASITDQKNSSTTLSISRSRPMNSENTTSCLTIRPAHSVKPDSLCSGLKRSSTDSVTPLDLSIKRSKIDDSKFLEHKALSKNKIDNTSYYNNQAYSSEDVFAKKHRKLKHLWINKTDSNSQAEKTCSCTAKNIEKWSVEQVANFIKQLDGCRSYSEKFREYNIGGTTLQSFTTDHLIRGFGMKVGPAIVLSEAIAHEVQNSSRRSISCHQCHSQSLRDEQNVFYQF